MTDNEVRSGARARPAGRAGGTRRAGAGAAVRAYLQALEAQRPRRGRKRTLESIERRLAAVEAQLAGGVDVITRLNLTQERLDLRHELEELGRRANLAELEDQFVAVAAEYAAQRRIGYAAWRELGVPSAVLARAGIARGLGADAPEPAELEPDRPDPTDLDPVDLEPAEPEPAQPEPAQPEPAQPEQAEPAADLPPDPPDADAPPEQTDSA
ncbi:MAG: hypothetical protein ACKVWR_12595 [Acidimicrobiales bacterium]